MYTKIPEKLKPLSPGVSFGLPVENVIFPISYDSLTNVKDIAIMMPLKKLFNLLLCMNAPKFMHVYKLLINNCAEIFIII